MSLRDLCNSPSGAGGGLERNPAQCLMQSALQWKYQTICRLLQHYISIWSCIKATHSLPLWSLPKNEWKFELFTITGEVWNFTVNVVTAGGKKRRKKGFNVLHPLWQKTWVLLSQVNVLENERVIMSGNTCIMIITSHSNYYIQSVMSHCKKISLLISRKQKGLEDTECAEKHPELSNNVSCLLL